MSALREFLNRLQFFRRRRGGRFEREMQDELQFHIEARAVELEDQGLSKDQALRRARAEFGSMQRAREDSRDAWQFQWLEHFLTDLRVGFRMLRRSPGFSLLAVLCLTLGIGANAAVFSWVEGILIRTPLAPQEMASTLGREIHTLDSNLALYEVITLQEQLDRSTAAQKAAVTLLGVLGALALLLGAIGLYGVMSYSVSQSARELALRMALGARASHLLRLVIAQGLALTLFGVVLGASAAMGLTRLLANYLYRVSPHDPLAFAFAFAVMLLATLAACLLPAWRATRRDPMRALRGD